MFSAILIDKQDDVQSVSLTQVDEANLPDGDVTIDVAFSTLNYKDGLAITGKSPIALADDLGALGPHAICVHLTDARPDELERVARRLSSGCWIQRARRSAPTTASCPEGYSVASTAGVALARTGAVPVR